MWLHVIIWICGGLVALAGLSALIEFIKELKSEFKDKKNSESVQEVDTDAPND